MGLFSSDQAPLNENNLPDQAHKVYIVTGSTAGVGKELASILFGHNAIVYIAARSKSKAESTIKELQQQHPHSSGRLNFLFLELSDLTTIKKSAQDFLSQEKQLHVLVNNAGVMVPPQGSETKQGYELQLGVNNLGPFLFTKLLAPVMVTTAQSSPPGTVRVVWTSSQAVKRYSPPGGIDMANLSYKQERDAWYKYGTSKAGNIFHSTEFANRYRDLGVLSVACDPGLLKTDLYDNVPRWQKFALSILPVLKDPVWGAYVELFCACSPEVSVTTSGSFVVPWGQFGDLREDVATSTKTKADGGTGVSAEFWKWCEEQVTPYE